MPFDKRLLEFLSDQSNDYDIHIDDTGYGGGVVESTLGEDAFVLNYPVQTATSPRTINFLPSQVTISFKVQTAADQTMIESIKASPEDRYKVKILRNGAIYWVGFVINDTISWTDESTPREFTLRATDGLGRLKDIPYNDAGTRYTGRETILQHIFKAMSKVNFDYFYATSDEYLKVICNWYEDQHTVVSTLDPLVVTDLIHSVFYTRDDKGNYKYKSCYDVLKYCLQAFQMRLFQSDGVWRVEQINERENAVFTEFIYDKDQVHLSTDTAATYEEVAAGTGQTLPRRLEKGRFTYYQPLDEVCLKYNHNGSENLLLGTQFNYSLVGGLNNQGDNTLGNVDINSNNDSLLISGTVNFKANWITPQDQPTYRHIWRLKCKVGTYYLKRTISNQGQVSYYNAPEWTTTESWIEITSLNLFQEGTTADETLIVGAVPFVINTPALPESGDIIFDFFWDRCVGINYQTYGTSLPNTVFALAYDLVSHEVRILQDGEQVNMETARDYCVTNDVTGNSSKVDLETIFADGPYNTTFNKLKVYDGSSWQISNDWRVDDTGTAYQLQELMIREILAGQKTSIDKYTGSIKGNLFAHTRIQIDSTYYLFLGGSFHANSDIWTGTWFEINRDSSGITTGPEEPEGPTQIPHPGLPSDTGIGTPPIGTTGVTSQGPTQTTAPITPGIVSGITVTSPVGMGLSAGDQIQIVNPAGGNIDIATVAQAPVAGDTEILIEENYLNNSYPNGAVIIPLPSETVPEAQAAGEIVSDFFINGSIDEENYFFKTNILLPETKNFQPYPRTTTVPTGTTDFFFVTPSHLDGATIEKVFFAVDVAGTGGSDTVIILLQTGEGTIHTATITNGTTYTQETLATPSVINTGDVLSISVSTVSTTPPTGLFMALEINRDQTIYLNKITYQLNRIVTTGLQAFYKFGYRPNTPISRGSIEITSASYIDCTTDTSTDLTGALSMAIWVKFTEFTSTEVIMSRYESATGYELVKVSGSIRLDFDAQVSCSFSTSAMDAYKWYHLAVTYDLTDAKIFLDGEQKNSVAYTAASTIATDFRIGANGGSGTPGNTFNGFLSMGRLWNQALTIDQVQSTMIKRYANLTASEKLYLVSAWELDDVSATTVPDSVENNEGTIT